MVGRYIGDMLMLCVFGPSSGKMKSVRYHHICIFDSLKQGEAKKFELKVM